MKTATREVTAVTRQLEETIKTLEREDALRVLDAVSGTLETLRLDANEIGQTPELNELVSRIEAYLGHLGRQRQRLD